MRIKMEHLNYFGIADEILDNIYKDYCKIRADENGKFLNYSVYLTSIERKIKLLRELEVKSVEEYRIKNNLN